jgi:hypothetical protein
MTGDLSRLAWPARTAHNYVDQLVPASVRPLQQPKHLCVQCPREQQSLHHVMTVGTNRHMHRVISECHMLRDNIFKRDTNDCMASAWHV